DLENMTKREKEREGLLEKTKQQLEEKNKLLQERETEQENMTKREKEREGLLENMTSEVETSKRQLESLEKELQDRSSKLHDLRTHLQEQGRELEERDSRRDEAVPEPAGPETEHPVAPPRGEEGKQSVAGVRAVLFDAACPPQTSLALDSLNGGEWGASDAVGSAY